MCLHSVQVAGVQHGSPPWAVRWHEHHSSPRHAVGRLAVFCHGVLHRDCQFCRLWVPELMVHLSLQCSQPIIRKGTAKLSLRGKNLCILKQDNPSRGTLESVAGVAVRLGEESLPGVGPAVGNTLPWRKAEPEQDSSHGVGVDTPRAAPFPCFHQWGEQAGTASPFWLECLSLQSPRAFA